MTSTITIDGIAAAMRQLTYALAELDAELVSPFWAAFSDAYRTSASPSQLRRWERDLARLNRRPALIHNGRRAR